MLERGGQRKLSVPMSNAMPDAVSSAQNTIRPINQRPFLGEGVTRLRRNRAGHHQVLRRMS